MSEALQSSSVMNQTNNILYLDATNPKIKPLYFEPWIAKLYLRDHALFLPITLILIPSKIVTNLTLLEPHLTACFQVLLSKINSIVKMHTIILSTKYEPKMT